MPKIFWVENPARFDESAELAMGLHFAVERDKSERANLQDGDAYLVFNGFIGVRVRDVLYSNSPIRFYPDLGVSKQEDHWILSEERLDLQPNENVEFLIRILRLPEWSQERFRQHGRVHGSPPFFGRTSAAAQFVRFSAFSNDRRITPSLGLLPGTYATSKLDADMIPTALTVVGHYALPTILPPVYRFQIVPPPLTEYYYGTVSPAFGQSGGGTEIEFFRGVQDGAVSGPLMIPYL
jgi:hypothetical protein